MDTDYGKDMHGAVTNEAVITPFPGRQGSASQLQYGLQPGATPVMEEMVKTLDATIDRCEPHALAAAAKATMRGYFVGHGNAT